MTRSDLQRLQIDVRLNPAGLPDTMADEVRAGLSGSPKTLPSKYFYDARGSELFERITELPEYYQTRTELEMLRRIARPLIEEHEFAELVEPGSGSALKTALLLDAMDERGHLRRYLPVDVSESMLRRTAGDLLERYPGLEVHGLVGDFQRHLSAVPPPADRRLVIFLGSTIGNLEPEERRVFLSDVRGLLGPAGCFLLGVDLVKDRERLEAAYNDSAGVTAEFNRNILGVVNGGLSGDFAPQAFRHYAFYHAAAARIEMHLIPDTPQRARLEAIPLTVEIDANESIRTEISCKFTRETTSEMLLEAGLRLREWRTDPAELFGLALADAA